MPTNPSTEELYTTVENLTGAERSFGFLGPRGMRLGIGEVVTIPGDLIASLGAQNQTGGKRRRFDALERSLKAGDIRIRSLPAPILWDLTQDTPQTVQVDNGLLGVTSPDYNTLQSSSSSSSIAGHF